MAILRRILGLFGVILLLMVGGLAMVRPSDKPLYFLAFISDDSGINQVYRVSPDGAHLKSLTAFPENNIIWQVDWSPDAHWIAIFYGDQKLYITSALGQEFRQVSPDIALSEAYSPIWSSDSTAFFYTYFEHEPFVTAIHLFQIADSSIDNISQAWQQHFSQFKLLGWLGDSKNFLIQANNGTSDQLYAITRDGKTVEQLTHIEDNSFNVFALSPDNLQILYSYNGINLYHMDLQSKEIIQLSTSERLFNARNVRWSPDSQWIVFASDYSGKLELYRIRSNGTDLLQLTNGDYKPTQNVTNFAWSPDSQWIVYKGARELYKIFVDGTGKQKIPLPCNDKDVDLAHTVSPDGKWLISLAQCGLEYVIYRTSSDGKEMYQMNQPSDTCCADPRWSPIIDLDWHGFALAALGCGAIILRFSHKLKFLIIRAG